MADDIPSDISDEHKEEMIEIAEELTEGLRVQIKEEEKVQQILNSDLNEISDAINTLEDELQEEKDEENTLSDILEDMRAIENALESLKGEISSSETVGTSENQGKKVTEQHINKFESDIVKEIKDLKSNVENLKKVVTAEHENINKAVQEVIEVVQEFEEIMQFIEEAKEDVEEAAELEANLDGYAKHFNLTEVVEMIETGENTRNAREILEKIEEMTDEDNGIEPRLERADKLLQKDIEYEEEEMNELQELVEDEGTIISHIEEIRRVIPGYESSSDVDGMHNVGQLKALMQEAEEELKQVLQSLERIEEEEGEQYGLEEEAEGLIRSTIQSVLDSIRS